MSRCSAAVRGRKLWPGSAWAVTTRASIKARARPCDPAARSRVGVGMSVGTSDQLTLFVQVVDPAYEFRNLHRRDVEIDDQPLLATSGQHAAQLHLLARVDFLMRYVGGHVDEIPRPRLGDEFQPLAPAQACKAADYVDHAFEIAVMVHSRLRFRLDGDRAGP